MHKPPWARPQLHVKTGIAYVASLVLLLIWLAASVATIQANLRTCRMLVHLSALEVDLLVLQYNLYAIHADLDIMQAGLHAKPVVDAMRYDLRPVAVDAMLDAMGDGLHPNPGEMDAVLDDDGSVLLPELQTGIDAFLKVDLDANRASSLDELKKRGCCCCKYDVGLKTMIGSFLKNQVVFALAAGKSWLAASLSLEWWTCCLRLESKQRVD